MKKVLLPVMLVLAGLLAGCSSGSSSSSTPTLTSIAVTPASPSITVGQTQQFTATGTYSNNTTQDLTATATWTSSTTSTATITSGGLATPVAAGSTTITASVTGSTVTGSTTLTVTAVVVVPTLTSIVVAPVTPSVAAGQTVQFSAMGTYSDGSTQVLTSTATWSSSNTAVATIAAGGLATTLIQGTSTITAAVGSVSGTTLLTVGPAVLESITVTPANDSVPVGTLTQFTATGTYSDKSTQDLTSTVTWTSSTTSVATVAATGVVTALAVNATPVTITATDGNISGNTQLTVTNATLNSITITGAPSVTIANLTSYKFSAFGSYNDGSKRNITSQVTWTSSQTSVATISVSGVATALSAGTTTITATSGAATASVTLVVTAATVSSIVVAPSNQTLEPGTTQPYTAVGNFNDGTTQTITQNVSWSSSKTTVATISNTSPDIGLATAVAAGTTTISATFEGVIGSTPLHVGAGILKSITLTPASAGMAINSTLSLQCVGKYSDGRTLHIEPFATWTSSNTAVATVNSIGIVKGVSIGGPVTITCAIGSVSATASITVEALTGITITPASPSVAAGISIDLTATGTLTDGSTQNLTNSVEWTSSDTAAATVGSGSTSAGVVTGIAPGTSTVTAAFSGQVGVTQVTVTSATLVSIAITPPNPIIALGVPLQFLATGTFSDGSTENLLGQVTWASSNNAVAIIDPTGAISTTGKGTTTITATLDGVSDTTVLTVH
jgi:trimeric autotransporter adhesin